VILSDISEQKRECSLSPLRDRRRHRQEADALLIAAAPALLAAAMELHRQIVSLAGKSSAIDEDLEMGEQAGCTSWRNISSDGENNRISHRQLAP